jgi:hypothetical protein
MKLSLVHVFWAYLALGVLVAAGLWLAGRVHRRGQTSLHAAVARMNPARASAWYRFREDVLLPLIFLALVSLVWPLALHAQFSKPWWMRDSPSSDPEPEPEFAVLPQHLLERLSVQKIELREQVDDPLHAVPPLPFGHLNAPWRQLLEQQAEGDEFWSFQAPWSLPWGAREQRRGYALVRAGVVVAWMLTLIQGVPDETP